MSAPASAQTTPAPVVVAPAPVPRPDPTEIPIGTEANAPQPVIPEATAVQPPAAITLKVATWHLAAQKPGEQTSRTDPARPPTTTWRHTFGSERTTAAWRKRGAGFAADIIALQGVSGNIHRTFNAREYHVVASRQLLASATSASTAIFRAGAPLTTAVVFRRRLGVRVAGFRHFLPPTAKGKDEPPAITAFRLRIYGRLLWIASLDIPADCPADMASEACAPHAPVIAKFSEWSARVARQTAPLLLLGRWPQTVVDKLKQAGLEIRNTLAATATCSPAPSGMLIAAPPSTRPEFSALSNTQPVATTPCAATAELTIKLR